MAVVLHCWLYFILGFRNSAFVLGVLKTRKKQSLAAPVPYSYLVLGSWLYFVLGCTSFLVAGSCPPLLIVLRSCLNSTFVLDVFKVKETELSCSCSLFVLGSWLSFVLDCTKLSFVLGCTSFLVAVIALLRNTLLLYYDIVVVLWPKQQCRLYLVDCWLQALIAL